ncbi:MAG: glycoside hydrolase domain-containing protein, partial [Victivallaceae bacterium]
MHPTIISTLFMLTLSTVAEIPDQFNAWGKKAPQNWVNAVTIPDGWKRIVPPDSNITEPEYSAEQQKKGFVLFSDDPFATVYPETCPLPEKIDFPIKAFATPGEYISLKFSIRPLHNLHGAEIAVEPIADSKGTTIPAENIDLRIVRNIPWMSASKAKCYYLEPRYMEAIQREDKFDLPAKQTQSFWITVKIPEIQPSGKYAGKISVLVNGQKEQSLKLQLLVL